MKPFASKNCVLCIWLPHWPLQRHNSLSPGERVGVRGPAFAKTPSPCPLPRGEGSKQIAANSSSTNNSAAARSALSLAPAVSASDPGMSLAEATALGNVECQENDPLADRAALLQLAGWCEQFGPIVGIEEPDNLLVDVTGLGSLFGGEERLAEQVVRAFQRLGLTVRVAIADTVGAAWAICTFGKRIANRRTAWKHGIRAGRNAVCGFAIIAAGNRTARRVGPDDHRTTAIVATFHSGGAIRSPIVPAT